MDKNDLRNKYINIRNNIDNKNVKSNIIFNKIINDEVFNSSKVIGMYYSLKSEVDTHALIEYALDIGKIVCLPKIVKDNMKFYKIDYGTRLKKSKFGVLEPPSKKENLVTTDDIDLLIVPGVCFGKDRNRIGFGKGYYDKYISNNYINTIGLCFSEQIVDYINCDSHDVKINKVITDTFDY